MKRPILKSVYLQYLAPPPECLSILPSITGVIGSNETRACGLVRVGPFTVTVYEQGSAASTLCGVYVNPFASHSTLL